MVLNATIDPIKRRIEFDKTPFSCRTDHDVTGIQFTCPNDIGISVDLMDMVISVRYANGRKELFTYHVIEKTLDGDNVIFTWILDEPANRYDGLLYFNVCAEYISGNTTKRWNTQISSIEVFRTLDEGDEEPTPEEVDEFERLLAQLNTIVTDYQATLADEQEVYEEIQELASSAETAAETATTQATEATTAASTATSKATEASTAAATATTKATLAAASESIASSAKAAIMAAYPTDEASGSIAICEKAAEGAPVKSLQLDISPVQDLHGYDSPWPAGGGKNLLQNTAVSVVVSDVTFTVGSDGTVKANGTASANAYFKIGTVTLPAGTYVLSGCPANGSTSTYRLYDDGTWTDVGAGSTVTLSESTTKNIYIRVNSGVTVSNLIFKPMICLSSANSPTTFAPYSNICPITGWTGASVTRTNGKESTDPDYAAQAYPISWQAEAGTVYGGHVDLSTGELVVDRASVDLGTLSWTYLSAYNFFSCNAVPNKANGLDNWICSQYPFGGWWSNWGDKDKVATGNLNNNSFSIKDTAYADATAFKTAMSGVQLVYELATPLTYQLTPAEITTILGTNYIWNDISDTDVVYCLDPLTYVDEHDISKASVITASASGSIASFSDGADGMPMESLVVGIEPVQDLHGYDSPWPAGGGKNLLDPSDITNLKYINSAGSIIATAGWSVSGYIPVEEGATYVLNTTNTGTAAYHAFYDSDKEFVSTVVSTTNPVTIPSGISYIRLSMKTLGNDPATTAQFESGSAATSYAPYSNICPITGWTGASVKRTGKNLFDADDATDGVYISNDDGSERSATGSAASGYIVVKPGYTYRISPNKTAGNWGAWYDINKSFISGFSAYSAPKTAPENAAYMRITVNRNNVNDGWRTNTQVEIGSTATEYEPYTGQTITSDWQSSAGTVYGGSLDVKTGVLTVDRASVDLGTLNFSYGSNIFYSTKGPVFGSNGLAKFEGTIISDMYVRGVVSLTTPVNGRIHIANSASSPILRISDNRFTSADDFNTAVSGHIIVYELKTPITYQLTAQQMTTLLGQNNIFADTGNTEVTYRADTKLYIEQLTKPEEDDMTANANIASGKFFMVGNRLFLSSVAIAQGATIVPGSNCTEVSLADALNQLNES